MPLSQIFFYATLLFLPTQLAFHVWPDWALVLGRRIDYLAPTIFVTDILMVLTILSGYQTLKKIPASHVLVLSLLFLFMIANTVFSTAPLVTFLGWIRIAELVLFGYYGVLAKPPLSRILTILSYAVLYSSAIAVVQYSLQHSIGGMFWILGERAFTSQTPGIATTAFCFPNLFTCKEFIRPYATFPHPNVLGGFLALFLPLLFWYFRRTKNRVTLASIILGSIALLLTFSRSAWIAFAVAVAWTRGIDKKSKPLNLFVSIVLAVSLCILLVFPAFYELLRSSESILLRMDLNRAAILLWMQHPVFGSGLKTFIINLPTLLPSRSLFFLQPVHNVFLLIVSETGIAGMGVVCILLLKFYAFLRRRKHYYGLVLVTLLLLLGMVDHYPLTLQQGQMLTVLLLTLGFFQL